MKSMKLIHEDIQQLNRVAKLNYSAMYLLGNMLVARGEEEKDLDPIETEGLGQILLSLGRELADEAKSAQRSVDALSDLAETAV